MFGVGRCSWRRCHARFEIDPTLVEPDRKASGAALVRTGRLAALETDDPVVQRAGDLAVMHDAFAQRAVLVRTAVLEREHLVARRPEQCDLHVPRAHDAATAQGNAVDRADLDPGAVQRAHSAASRKVRSATGVNSCASLPWADRKSS